MGRWKIKLIWDISLGLQKGRKYFLTKKAVLIIKLFFQHGGSYN